MSKQILEVDQNQLVKEMISALASRCDGAMEKDFVGFNKPDAYIGQKLANTEMWKKSWYIKAHEMLHKYQKQLKNYGFNYDELDPANFVSDFGDDESDEITLDDLEKMEWSEIKTMKIKGVNWKVRTVSWEYGFWTFYKAHKHALRDMNIILNYPAPELIEKIERVGSIDISFESLKEILLEKKPKFVSKIGKYVRSIEIKEIEGDFWDFYRKNKESLKSAGFSVKKDSYNYMFPTWVLNLWTTEEFPDDLPRDEDLPNDEPEVQEDVQEIDFSDTILYNYQQLHASKLAKALQKFDVAVDTSSTGTGKTFTAISICQKLNLKFLVICPKAVIPAWRKSVKFVHANDLCQGIVNYELIKIGKYYQYQQSKSRRTNKITGVKEFYEISKKVKCPFINVEKNENKGRFEPKWLISWNIPDDMVIIWDEAHRCKNKTINSQMMIEATEAGAKQLLLTATLGESPLKMYGTAKALGLYDKPWEFYTQFASNHQCSKEVVNRWSGATAWVYHGGTYEMSRIHQEIRDKIDGMDADELREKGLFPKTLILAENYNLNGNNAKIEKVYEKMFERIRELSQIKESMEKESEENRLSILQKAMQEVELLKVPAMVEMAEDAIESGYSVAIFVNYVDSVHSFIEALMKKKLMKTPTTIYGKNDARTNESNRLKFEKNEERVIVCNMAAAKEGIDLHDKFHEYKRISLITPNYSSQILKQVLGRIDRAGGTDTIQKIVYGMGTVEERICEAVKRKLSNISALNDGDVNPLELF